MVQPIVLINEETIYAQSKELYVFKSKQGKFYWPKRNGQQLGRCGMWNFLWRIGFHPQETTIKDLPNATRESVLFFDENHIQHETTKQKLFKWMHQGGKIVATGAFNAWDSFLPQSNKWRTSSFDNPYAGLAYILNNYPPQLIGPNKWSFLESDAQPEDQWIFLGNIAAVQGERQTPARAIIKPANKAPAIIHNDLFYYLNGHPFSALQSWLQGQEDLSPWLSWRNRLCLFLGLFQLFL